MKGIMGFRVTPTFLAARVVVLRVLEIIKGPGQECEFRVAMAMDVGRLSTEGLIWKGTLTR